MNDIAVWFRHVDAVYGINLPMFYDTYDRVRFLHGLELTLWLSFITIILSVILGMLGAWLQTTSSRISRAIVSAYVSVFRNTPPLIQIYFFYFGLGAAIPAIMGTRGSGEVVIGAISWAVIALSLGAGAMNVEIFRSGIESVPSTMIEASESLGFSKFGQFRHVVAPMAFRICLPALTNNLVNLIKTTTLAYAIGVPELLYVSAQIWSSDFNVRAMMVVLLIAYLVIVGVFVLIMHFLERAIRMPGYG